MSDVTDEVYEAAVRAYFDDKVGSRDYLQILLERDMYEHRFRAALAVAFDAGRKSTFEDSAEEWVVTFQDSPYAQPQRYASEFSREHAMEAAAEAVRLGYKSVRVRVRYRSSWSDVAVEAGGQP